jgi:hypothetical protein
MLRIKKVRHPFKRTRDDLRLQAISSAMPELELAAAG